MLLAPSLPGHPAVCWAGFHPSGSLRPWSTLRAAPVPQRRGETPLGSMQEEDLNLVGRRGQLGSLQLGPDLLDAEPERKNGPDSGMWGRSAFGISLAFPCYSEMLLWTLELQKGSHRLWKSLRLLQRGKTTKKHPTWQIENIWVQKGSPFSAVLLISGPAGLGTFPGCQHHFAASGLPETASVHNWATQTFSSV